MVTFTPLDHITKLVASIRLNRLCIHSAQDPRVLAGGSVNDAKLKVFHVRHLRGRLRLIPGNLPSLVGELKFSCSSLRLAGIPLLMGGPIGPLYRDFLQRVQVVRAGLLRLRPTYILCLRVLLAYGVSKLDFVHDALPPVSLIVILFWMLAPFV